MTGAARLAWLFRQAPPREAAARLRLAATKRLSRGWRPRIPKTLSPRPVFASLADRENTRTAFDKANLTAAAVAEAERVLNGCFTLFGGLEYHPPDGAPDWNVAWPQGAPWPTVSSFNIDIAGNEGADIRFTWELSRCGDLVALARAAFLTGRDDFRGRLEAHLQSWMQACPYLAGPNWISALEVALRALALAFIDEAAPMREAAAREKFLGTLFAHGMYLDRFATVGLNPNNHLIGEAAGLFILGGKFAGTARGRRWRERGRRILEDEIIRQTWPSGASRENSIGYHRFVTGVFALCAATAPGAFSQRFAKRLAAMYRFLCDVARPDGTFAAIGDSDEAVVLRLRAPSPGDLSKDLAFGAALLDAPNLALAGAAGPSAEVLWLLGPQVSPAQAPAPGGRKSTLIGGVELAVLRSQTQALQVEFDCGPHGFAPVASHGHADALSVTLWRGEDRLIDPGTYRYNAAPDWRGAFRSSFFHNTVTVDSLPQARPAGPFRWWTLADAHAEGAFFDEGFDWAAGALPPHGARGWRHQREVLRVGNTAVIILDRLERHGHHEATARFHVGRARLAVSAGSAKVVYEDSSSLRITSLAKGIIFEKPETAAGMETSLSRSYGVRQSSSVAAAVHAFDGEAFLPWVLTFDAATVTPLEVEKGEAAAVEICADGKRFVFICLARRGLAHVGDVRFTGRWVLLEMTDTSIARAWAADAWALDERQERLFTAFGGARVGRIYDGADSKQ